MSAWRPGDRRADTASMLRVDQAGEYGATRIYAGQLAVLRRNCPEAKLIARMAAQEERHLARFDHLIAERRVRPTALQPLWNVAGFALGSVPLPDWIAVSGHDVTVHLGRLAAHHGVADLLAGLKSFRLSTEAGRVLLTAALAVSPQSSGAATGT